ncbi:MAG: pyruvate kinase [Candidatus Peregrinibacteria bacterium]|nr:pyruvate kinase [Candidatus Peregrinibacteria bacterium]
MKKNTKIVCTLGPASDEKTVLEKIIMAGMNVARLNFSHGDYDHMKKIFKNIRSASKNCKKTVAILQDLQGPKIRLGKLPEEGVPIQKGKTIILSTDGKPFNDKEEILTLPVQYRNLHKDVKAGDNILLDDGYFEVVVEKVQGHHIHCKVKTSGLLKSNKGINCPTASISANTITEKDRKDLIFGLKQGIDYVALSFVKSADDILELRKLLENHGHPNVKIIAKIERHEAIKNLEEIAQVSDGLMVARGDLGIEIPAEQVPIVQKEIVHFGMLYAKPVIIATQILESMINNPRPTRAEISDAATTIFDHADAFMLSAETSVGKYPVCAVRTLAKVAHATENSLLEKEHLLHNHLAERDMPITDATCFGAALLAENIEANTIVVITKSGYTARQIMKHRPHTHTIAITYSETTKRQLQLVWGLNDIIVVKEKIQSEASAGKNVPKLLKTLGCVKKDDELVIVNAGRRHNFITTIVI